MTKTFFFRYSHMLNTTIMSPTLGGCSLLKCAWHPAPPFMWYIVLFWTAVTEANTSKHHPVILLTVYSWNNIHCSKNYLSIIGFYTFYIEYRFDLRETIKTDYINRLTTLLTSMEHFIIKNNNSLNYLK